jgi:NTP pyrophosphatase (non-canonical NTP hydrolase)
MTEGRTLAEMQEEVDEFNTSHGWKDRARSFGDDMALLHSEVSETFEAWRNWQAEDVSVTQCKDPLHDDYSYKVSDADLGALGHFCKPEGIGSELADVLVRLLDTCARYDIDLQAEFDRKMAYNRTRPYRHGGKHV